MDGSQSETPKMGATRNVRPEFDARRFLVQAMVGLLTLSCCATFSRAQGYSDGADPFDFPTKSYRRSFEPTITRSSNESAFEHDRVASRSGSSLAGAPFGSDDDAVQPVGLFRPNGEFYEDSASSSASTSRWTVPTSLDLWGDPSPMCPAEPWCFQSLPDGLIYRSYLAGMKEPGFRSMWMSERTWGGMWDISLGWRSGLFRYGTTDSVRPQGWQVDIEGAGLVRLDLENHRELMASDFRFGAPVTWGDHRWQWKLGYYHLSSHLGDEFSLRFPAVHRRNYVRDEFVLGLSWTPTDHLRFYGEMGWAFFTGEGTKPWEFQFGFEYSHLYPDPWYGSPFFAINAHLREEVDFGGGLTVQTGWQWRGQSGHLFRAGLQYYNGMSEQFEFYDQFENKVGFGFWYNF